MDRNSACKTKMHPVYLNIVWLNWWTLSKIGDISFMRGECMYLLIRNGKYSNTFCTNTNIFVTIVDSSRLYAGTLRSLCLHWLDLQMPAFN